LLGGQARPFLDPTVIFCPLEPYVDKEYVARDSFPVVNKLEASDRNGDNEDRTLEAARLAYAWVSFESEVRSAQALRFGLGDGWQFHPLVDRVQDKLQPVRNPNFVVDGA